MGLVALRHGTQDTRVVRSGLRIEVDHATAQIAPRDGHRSGVVPGTESEDVTDPGVLREGLAARQLDHDVRSESARVELEAQATLDRHQRRTPATRDRRPAAD